MSAPRPARSEAQETTRFLLRLVLLVLLVRSFVASPFTIPSESMLPRLLIGDYLFVAKWPYGYSRYALPFSPRLWDGRIWSQQPERGDIVVFRAPADPDTDYIKRVIGLPGDLVELRGGQVILNGKTIPKRRIADFIEPLTLNSACAKAEVAQFRERNSAGGTQCRYPRFRETLPSGRQYDVLDQGNFPQDNTQVFSVPAGQLFVMGDNRDRSADSRFPAVKNGGVGLVPQENLVGRAWFGVFSSDGTASLRNPASWFRAIRRDRIGNGF